MKKHRLEYEITTAYYIAIVDETGKEIDSDWCFLTRQHAKEQAERMLRNAEWKEEEKL